MATIEGTFPGEIPGYIVVLISGSKHAHTFIKKDDEPGETFYSLNKGTHNEINLTNVNVF